MKELQKVVRETIQRYQMIVPGDIVIAGVSGGPDSLTMLHLLKELQDDFAFRLHVAHVDHSFRGKEAEDEALWVKETAEKWGLPCTLTKINVPQIAREKGVSAQEAGHFIRKKFFFELLKKLGAQKIALGHQADDQAETVLMHFLVGAGLEGLQGIVPKNGPLIRPLLYLRREEIEAYCQENSLEPRR
ncbi:MAG: tRNA lysidine(34) synthetase TilS, partial [Clostridia bacterium]|nr:tRNA lysidine(34) synthetase TilS [Clostridia bacterium]